MARTMFQYQHSPSMRPAGYEPQRLVLRCGRTEPGGFFTDATSRRAVHQDAFLRFAANGGLFAGARFRGQPQTGPAIDEADGLGGHLPEKEIIGELSSPQSIPLFVAWVMVETPDQVWSTDITYIRLRRGFMYPVAIMDWFSRYVLAWRLSNTLDVGFCLEALEEALKGRRPGIFNSDQGVQFTSRDFTERLERDAIPISMDGRGRAFDNIFIERLWRSVKYEEVYLNDYDGVLEAQRGLGRYFRFYNLERPHQALGYQTPATVYSGMKSSQAVVIC